MRFINTHLELPTGPSFDIQALQAAEILAGPANTTMPVILTGDFNSDANGLYGPSVYPLLTGVGQLTDAWKVVHPNDPGLTWGHDALLSDPTVPFVYRLDLILYRGWPVEATEAEVIDPVIGPSPPLWFSDHGGVSATIAIH